LRTALLCLACVVLALPAHSQVDSLAPAGHRSGLLFNFGALQAATPQGGSVQVWLGAGYALSDDLSLAVLFHTGHQSLAGEVHRPVDGTLLLGGASVELHAAVLHAGFGTLIAGGGAGLFTLVTQYGQGYNGYGMYALLGFDVFVGTAIDITPMIRIGSYHMMNGVGDGVEPFDAFNLGWAAAGLTITFRPTIHPF
jgi:hypothetical protein